ncbi:MerR family transcriptional regulator [Niallia taxi]|uniref:MerR family transcriptional regulator n=1 Tax=Niallia taxi TaxID=2499688 RepID=A0A3S2X2B4_9BACI|nr:MerR family transcriptional regulator [Niallia taxi]MCM3216636.1 MerR family transcriptional regulator [Niallia taxi]MDK8639995.1 MerR family transcriptional regulator [Niallia taxi]MED4038886.1 MerR family transcriptional regulator [Niallia taxi]MED4053963.1 MerR family transcriptional regulator [Niallia taxi]MED4118516.1 MerR family transcriptional regulator [Niallia taxi]
MDHEPSYKKRKVITIGVVSELTGLTERQIRYYEQRKLIFPERPERGNRKYSFSDVERLIEIANKREEGVRTHEIRQEIIKKNREEEERKIKKQMLRGQINARFGIQKD